MKKIRGNHTRPRLAVFRSNQAIYGQIIDDEQGKTMAAASSKEIKLAVGKSLNKTEKAKLVGQLLAQKALKKSITLVVFDRRKYPYHGRIKALAEGAREGGLKF
jgi:large subunit ribosomal protein L18